VVTLKGAGAALGQDELDRRFDLSFETSLRWEAVFDPLPLLDDAEAAYSTRVGSGTATTALLCHHHHTPPPPPPPLRLPSSLLAATSTYSARQGLPDENRHVMRFHSTHETRIHNVDDDVAGFHFCQALGTGGRGDRESGRRQRSGDE